MSFLLLSSLATSPCSRIRSPKAKWWVGSGGVEGCTLLVQFMFVLLVLFCKCFVNIFKMAIKYDFLKKIPVKKAKYINTTAIYCMQILQIQFDTTTWWVFRYLLYDQTNQHPLKGKRRWLKARFSCEESKKQLQPGKEKPTKRFVCKMQQQQFCEDWTIFPRLKKTKEQL